MADLASAFAAAFLVTHRPINDVARAVASRRAWEDAVSEWAARETRDARERLLCRRDAVARHREQRVTQGMCAACLVTPAPEDRATCQRCRDGINERKRAREAARLAAGMCAACGKRPLASTLRCAPCLAIDAKRSAAYAAKRKGLR